MYIELTSNFNRNEKLPPRILVFSKLLETENVFYILFGTFVSDRKLLNFIQNVLVDKMFVYLDFRG